MIYSLFSAGPGTFPPALAALMIALTAYFLGCFNGAVIVSKYILRNDVRKHGSGNAGLTNFYRTFGGPLTLLVILTDMLKAVLAVFLAGALLTGWGANLQFVLLGKYWAALWCLLGHMFPCMFRFKGGKGILSGAAVILMLDWRIALMLWAVFLLLALSTRYISLGSCCAAACFPVATHLVYGHLAVTLLAAFIALVVLWQHRGNLRRLIAGTESKFTRQRGTV